MSATKTGTARTQDGAEIAYTLYEDAGPKAPRVALIHSLALDRGVWEPVAERLASKARVLIYDCRGHGQSAKAAGPYTLGLFADDLADLLEEVDWGSAVVGGASMGGNVAQCFATTYPDRVSGLALADTTAWYGADAPQKWDERARQGEEKGLASMVDFQLTRWFSDAFRAEHPEVCERFSRSFVANDPACFAASARMLGSFDLRQAIKSIVVPTVVVVGEEDYATPPEMARQIHESIASSSLHILPGARHLSPLERADQIASLIESEVLAKARQGSRA